MILKHPRRRHRRHQNPYVSDVDPLAGAPAYDTTSGPNIVSMVQQLGPVVTGTPIQLVFWGQAYNSNTDPCPALVQAAFTVTSSAYTSKLAQYSSQEGNASIGALVQPSIFLSVDPPATYFDTDLISQAISQYASGNFGNITPIRDGTEGFPGILIVFVMPPNCSYGGPFAGGPGPQGAIGEHLEASVNGVIVPFAWIAFDVSTDLMTVDLSHEIVEMATDPFGLTDPAVATTNGGGPYASNPGALTEIADDGWEWFAAISGSLLATYWSNSDGACLVPGGFDTQKYSGCLVQTDTIMTAPDTYEQAGPGSVGDFYAVVPNRGPSAGLMEFVASNGSGNPVWTSTGFGLVDAGAPAGGSGSGRAIEGCCLIETNFQMMQVLATSGGSLLWYQFPLATSGNAPPQVVALGDWAVTAAQNSSESLNPPLVSVVPSPLNPRGPHFFGTPGVVQSTTGARGDFEVVALVRTAGGSSNASLAYFRAFNDWVGGDQPTGYPLWSGPTWGDTLISNTPLLFGEGLQYDDRQGGSVALIQAKSLSAQNNGVEQISLTGLGTDPAAFTLHAIVRASRPNGLYHFYTGAPFPNVWVGDVDQNGNLVPIQVNGTPITGVVGDQGFIEIDGTFLLAVAFDDGTVQVFNRPNTGSTPLAWSPFGPAVPVTAGAASVYLMKSNYPSALFSKRVELLVVNSAWTQLQHFFLNDAQQWAAVAAFGALNQ